MVINKSDLTQSSMSFVLSRLFNLNLPCLRLMIAHETRHRGLKDRADMKVQTLCSLT